MTLIRQDFSLDISKDLARKAYSNISYDPEVRGKRSIDDYVNSIQEIWDECSILAKTIEQEAAFESSFSTLREKAKTKFSSYLYALSNTVSIVITGPAGFPAERNRKAQISVERRWDEYSNAVSYYKKKLIDAVNAASTDEVKSSEIKTVSGDARRRDMSFITKDIDYILNGIAGSREGKSFPYSVDLLKASVESKLKKFGRTYGNSYIKELLEFAERRAKELNVGRLFTERHSLYKLCEDFDNGKAFSPFTQEHSKTKELLYMISIDRRVEAKVFTMLLGKAKEYGGYYSGYSKNGVKSGFVFLDEESRDSFLAKLKELCGTL